MRCDESILFPTLETRGRNHENYFFYIVDPIGVPVAGGARSFGRGWKFPGRGGIPEHCLQPNDSARRIRRGGPDI